MMATRRGWVGEITSNAFMKREFGRRLINEYFAHQVELDEVIDTSGAYIPGHGTPTVILVGRNRLVSGRYSGAIKTVLGIRGEPSQPEDPSRGLVWTAIAKQIDEGGSESEWVSVADADRKALAAHPWSLSGGGALDVVQIVDSSSDRTLSGSIFEIGFGAVTREDDAYVLGAGALRRMGVAEEHQLACVDGEATRDWRLNSPIVALWPYEPRSLQARLRSVNLADLVASSSFITAAGRLWRCTRSARAEVVRVLDVLHQEVREQIFDHIRWSCHT